MTALRKDQPGAGDVHAATALGNGRGKARTFRAMIGQASKPAVVGAAKGAWSLPLAVKKADPDKRLIFGWASIVTKDGKPIVDKQGDIIPVDELEKAFYDFVLYSRDHGDMHVRKGTGRLVECMVFTKEKQAVLGIDLGFEGAWTGFRVDDDAVWARHKRGELPEFSIGGAATPTEA